MSRIKKPAHNVHKLLIFHERSYNAIDQKINTHYYYGVGYKRLRRTALRATHRYPDTNNAADRHSDSDTRAYRDSYSDADPDADRHAIRRWIR